MPNQNKIVIKGARVNNLQNITVEIPKNKLVVITGLSGSGKSSLAFDTIFAEGQRRYVESLGSSARQFLELQDKPDVDEIRGLSPTIAIEQKGLSENPRSTVATITEIADFLRLLFARAGRPRCLECDIELTRTTAEEIVRQLKDEIRKQPVRILAPLLTKQNKTADDDILDRLAKAGFTEVRLNGEIIPLAVLKDTGLPAIPFTLDAAIGIYGPGELREDPEYVRLQILTALELGDGKVMGDNPGAGTLFFSKDLTCPKCGRTTEPFESRDFSFNSPHGACAACTGLGIRSVVIPELVIPNPRLSLAQGAIKPWTKIGANQSARFEFLKAIAQRHKFSLDAPVGELPKAAREIVLFGTGNEEFEIGSVKMKFPGVIPELQARYQETASDYLRKEIEGYMRQEICPDCDGTRLNSKARSVIFAGKNIAQVNALSVGEAITFFERFDNSTIRQFDKRSNHKLSNHQIVSQLTESELAIASPILKEITARLENLKNAGVEYLTLNRAAPTLSGGEGQRLRLAIQLSQTLSGVIYVLDEPTVGLHERDTGVLLKVLKRLKENDSTVIVVEHDAGVMREADWILDMGPGAGEKGGEVVSEGTLTQIMRAKASLTGAYLAKKQIITAPKTQKRGNGKYLTIKGATAFNLKDVGVKIPLGKFVCVAGVSGSGKSTLILEILARALAHKFYNAKDLPAAHKEITGIQHIDKVISVDQTPIGRTPRSNPATYTGIFTLIRDLYTEIPEAKLKGFDAGTFSFNVKGGRCEACAGEGYVKIPMQFMAETFLICPECKGSRYRQEALEIHYRGKNIAEVLKMSASEAKEFFSAKGGSSPGANAPREHASGGKDTSLICEKLQVLEDVGLGYVKLGQGAPTLSGGEAQRVKLATELSRRATGKTLYILDEPTTGLHFQDIQHLLDVLTRLVDKGNTVLVIEHNLDVIKCADWVIDMGPEGGDKGGEIVAEGTPRDICKVKRSYTGQYLKKILNSKQIETRL